MNLMRSLVFGVGLTVGVMAVAQDPDPSPTASPTTAEPVSDGGSLFNQLDIDRDGWLSESELKSYPQPLPLFVDLDQDADGKISTTEWSERAKFAEVEEDE